MRLSVLSFARKIGDAWLALVVFLMSGLARNSGNMFVYAVAVGVIGVLGVSVLLGLCMSAAGSA